MAINLNKNHNKIVTAWKDVIDDKSATNWFVVIFIHHVFLFLMFVVVSSYI